MKRSSNAAKAVAPQPEVPAPAVPSDVPQRIEFLPVSKVSESKSNPRKSFGDMTELASGGSDRDLRDARDVGMQIVRDAGTWSSLLTSQEFGRRNVVSSAFDSCTAADPGRRQDRPDQVGDIHRTHVPCIPTSAQLQAHVPALTPHASRWSDD